MPEYHDYGASAARYNANLRAQEQARADAARTMRERQETLCRDIERGSVSAMREFAGLLSAQLAVTIDVRSRESLAAEGAAAYAGYKRIVVPPLDSATDLAVYLHEFGHTQAESCRGGDHQPDHSIARWHHCVRCESEAWRIALTWAPFTWPMFAELRRCLQSYRRSTAAPRSAADAADRLLGTLTYYGEKQRRLKWAMRLERHRRVMESLR